MAQTSPRPLTKFDYWELPEAGPRYQLIEGDLLMAPAPNRFHQSILGVLFGELYQYLQAHPVGRIYSASLDVVLSDLNVFQPDLIFVSQAREHILTAQGAEGAPDLVVEILSPKTARLDLEQKRMVYARAGVTELWIVDPESRELRVFLLQQNSDLPDRILSGEQRITSPLLPGFDLSLTTVFREQ
jgi:Uma2 family endonuclease